MARYINPAGPFLQYWERCGSTEKLCSDVTTGREGTLDLGEERKQQQLQLQQNQPFLDKYMPNAGHKRKTDPQRKTENTAELALTDREGEARDAAWCSSPRCIPSAYAEP